VVAHVTSTPARRRQIDPPAWVKHCLPKKASDRFGPAPKYLGMRYHAIARYPPRRHVSLLFGGAAGTCYGMSDDVIRPNVIAIFYDRGDTRHFRIPASAQVVFAEKVSSYWQPGS
jgi:hypothetical protein